MEKEVNNKDWHLIRNDNGEWISDEYTVFLTPFDASILEARAGQQGKPFSIQHWLGGQLWCYRHELEAIDLSVYKPDNRKLKLEKMKRRTDDFEYLKSLLKDKTGIADLPQDYDYKLVKNKKNLVLTLSQKGLTANMQDNSSAFESWAIVLRFYLNDNIKTITIDWEDVPNNDTNFHFNRFVYRLSKFVQTFEWASTAKPIPHIPSVLVCNYPNKAAAKTEEHSVGSEGWIECKYIEKYGSDYDVMNHQLPVGIFYDKVGKYTHFTTGQKSAIDIWAIKDNNLYIFELKKPGNNVLGVISELMFYTNIFQDIMSHRILYQHDAKMQVAIKNNFRGFKDLYESYISGNIENINAVILADTIHPLIKPDLLDFINRSARLKYCRINYSTKKVEI